ncbi:extensin-like domain-containing protein [Cypionkella psychrotolerans]|uniref:extensin-like domain-containing protein n=1 Tax=Cypionkella psychrotolerans TaxID=1678131 RepID=UPI0006B506FC|nr:extensin family protein [Cypionkella psychrotolerans]
MRAIGPLTLILAVLGGMAMAEAPKSSPHPAPRPTVVQPETPVVAPILRPRHRPTTRAAEPQTTVEPARQQAAPEIAAVAPTLRPRPRPKGLQAEVEQVAMAQSEPEATPTRKSQKESRKGSVCGDPAIRGQELPPVTSRTKGCGIAEPVRVTAIDGIPFSQPATIDCDTALALKRWMREGMAPAFGNREVVQLHIFGSYMCRSRNNVRGAKISEHGRGKAVDIAGFIFSDGKEWTVARDYNKQIRRAQKAACGIFGTTLGPGSDGYHEDHLHFDTAERRGSAYCR